MAEHGGSAAQGRSLVPHPLSPQRHSDTALSSCEYHNLIPRTWLKRLSSTKTGVRPCLVVRVRVVAGVARTRQPRPHPEGEAARARRATRRRERGDACVAAAAGRARRTGRNLREGAAVVMGGVPVRGAREVSAVGAEAIHVLMKLATSGCGDKWGVFGKVRSRSPTLLCCSRERESEGGSPPVPSSWFYC